MQTENIEKLLNSFLDLVEKAKTIEDYNGNTKYEMLKQAKDIYALVKPAINEIKQGGSSTVTDDQQDQLILMFEESFFKILRSTYDDSRTIQ